MKQRILSVALALCLCISSQPTVYASQKNPSVQKDVCTEEGADKSDSRDNKVIASPGNALRQDEESTGESTDKTDDRDDRDDKNIASPGNAPRQEEMLIDEYADELELSDGDIPTPTEAYEAMIALKEDDRYKEGTTWTNDEPYSDSKGYYRWKGGTLGGKNIVAVGCVAFAFILSDEAFGSLPARMYAPGKFTFADIKVGDILRMNTDIHTVIVLEVSETGVVVAEGNISTGDHKGKVHWGRTISKEVVMRDTSHYITRYPEGYVAPDDPGANELIAEGKLDGGLNWNLTKAGTLTVSGKGDMPDFSGPGEQPWSENSSQIRKVVIEDGVTSIGNSAFYGNGVLSAQISSSVETIGSNAFYGSSLISVTVPSSVKTIGESAFRLCRGLSVVAIFEGVETIEQNAFRGCTSLISIDLPASIGEVGAGAFMECTEMRNASFASGSKQVKLGDNIFTRCYALMSVTLPASADRIGKEMFMNCGMLPGVQIPQGVECIAEGAFASTGVRVVIIPHSVTRIETRAFADCSLTDIYFTGTEAQWNRVTKIADTLSIVAKANIHCNYVPPEPEEPGDGDNGDDSGNKPGDDSGNKPGDDSSNKPGDDSGNKPGDDSGNKPGDDSSNKPGDDSSNKPGDDSSNKPGDDSSNKPGDDSSNKPGDDSSNKPGDDSSNKPGDDSSNKPGDDSNNKPGDDSNNKPGDNPGNTPPDNSSGSNTGNNSSSNNSSSSKGDREYKSSQNTSSNTAGGQWVVEDAGNGRGAGWKLKSDNGTYVAGTISVDMNGKVKEQVAWAQVNGSWYAFGADGYADSGWIMDEAAGSWYFVDINSGMQTGWHDDAADGATYFIDPVSGKMLVGWNLIEGQWYYFNAVVGEPTWQRDELTGDWIYTGSENALPFGAMIKGGVTPDGYAVDENGVWIG